MSTGCIGETGSQVSLIPGIDGIAPWWTFACTIQEWTIMCKRAENRNSAVIGQCDFGRLKHGGKVAIDYDEGLTFNYSE